ncbi:MAG: hypothetical protein M3Q23_15575 [Actinomycetota bacterium]|nr:hypothetical protein [Actinomycetota bacterium]
MNGQGGAAPSRISVRMHRVGFGDCFLLTFTYPDALDDNRSERHVLIDFGSTSLPTGWKDLTKVAAEINARTGGQIDAVVVTHRHRDHLSAFAVPDIVNMLQATQPPRLVVRSWTEDPDADANFTGGNGAPGADSLAFAKSLRSASEFADAMAGSIAARPGRSRLLGDLHQVALTQLANSDAVGQLATWSANGKGEYLRYGMTTSLESLLPGVRVKVLGPPTIEQHADVASERSSDPAEFWMLYRQVVGSIPAATVSALAQAARDDRLQSGGGDDVASTIGDLGPVRWLTSHLDRQQIGSFLRIVRVMDDALNNTSVILAFEVDGPGGTKRLLFPGDAQIENWEYALKIVDVAENTDLLRQVDLYKVGHHGSRNATPRSLFGLWTEDATAGRPMTAMMSTKSGVFGKTQETLVPRDTLVSALTQRMTAGMYDSEKLDGLWVEVSADTASADPFVESAHG